jgi:hemolysin activation/secretion protein
MSKSILAFVVLALSSSLLAQAPAPPREVVIANLSLTGASHLSQSDQLAIVAEVKSLCCRRNQPDVVKGRILDALQERGYFKAKVEKLEITPASQDSGQKSINVTAAINEGRQFRLKEVTFSGARAFSSEQLRSQFPVADGDIFNVEKVRAGLDAMRELYASQAYLNFAPVPNTDVDDSAGTIAVSIDLDEGQQFHFGRLVLDGEEPQAGMAAKLIDVWRPYEGKVYSPQVEDQYWKSVQRILPSGLKQKDTLAMKQDLDSATVFPRINFPDAK